MSLFGEMAQQANETHLDKRSEKAELRRRRLACPRSALITPGMRATLGADAHGCRHCTCCDAKSLLASESSSSVACTMLLVSCIVDDCRNGRAGVQYVTGLGLALWLPELGSDSPCRKLTARADGLFVLLPAVPASMLLLCRKMPPVSATRCSPDGEALRISELRCAVRGLPS